MSSNQFFSNFLIFRTEADNDNGHEGGGVAEDEGRKEGGGVGDISIKIKLTAFCMHLTRSIKFKLMFMLNFVLSVNGADLSEFMYFIF